MRTGRRPRRTVPLLGGLLTALLLAAVSPAAAHPLGLPAFARVAATGPDTVTVVWNAAPDDVALLARSIGFDVPPDGSLTREQDAELSAAPALHDALRRGIVVRQAAGTCTKETLGVDSIVTAGATLHLRCPQAVTAITLEVRLLSDLDDRYRTLVVAGGPEGLDRWMLSGGAPAHDFVLDPERADEVLAAVPATSDEDGPASGGAFGGSLPFERHVLDLLDATPTVLAVLLGLLIAFGVGAAHGLAPGHGKAIAAAYLVGDRARPRDAVLLGASVAAMHTGSVLVIGAVLYRATSRPSVAALSGWLQLVSGVVVAAVGVWLLQRRWRERRPALPDTPGPLLAAAAAEAPVAVPVPAGRASAGHAGAAPAGHAAIGQATAGHAAVGHDGHVHEDGQHHTHGTDLDGHGPHHTHAHGGGRPHTHALDPDVSPLSWRGLVALGAAGGLLPAPSALLVLFTALAVGRLGYGLGLIAAFSVGLALTVTSVGLAALWGRDLLSESLLTGRAATVRRHAPVVAASGVVVLGAAIAVRATSLLG